MLPDSLPKLRLTSVEALKEELLGPLNSPARDEYEAELALELLSERLKATRQQQQLSPAQLGTHLNLSGAQVEQLEANPSGAPIGDVLTALKGLRATVRLHVEWEAAA